MYSRPQGREYRGAYNPTPYTSHMKTIETTLYTPHELREAHPEGYKRALREWETRDNEIPWCDKIIDSLEAVFKAADVKLCDYSISTCSHSYVRFVFRQCEPMSDPGDIAEFTGKRAMAWLENHLFGPLRTPWRGPKRWRVSRYGRAYHAGRVKPCPLTGYCADEDFMQSLVNDVRSGSTLKDAFRTLADVAAKMMGDEDEYQRSEEAFLECDDGEPKYTEDGDLL